MQLVDILVRETRFLEVQILSFALLGALRTFLKRMTQTDSLRYRLLGERDATGRHLALKMQVLRVRVSSLPFSASLVQLARRCPAMAKTRVRIPHEALLDPCGSDATGRHPALKTPVLGVRFSSPALSEVVGMNAKRSSARFFKPVLASSSLAIPARFCCCCLSLNGKAHG